MPSKCDVYLENYDRYYCAGQQIVGHLLCTFSSDKTVKGIKIKFKGDASTRWSETERHYNSSTKRTESRTVWYSAEETYFVYEMNLLNNVSEVTVKRGVHKYPFTFTLPLLLPSSFRGQHGKVKYMIKGSVKRPFFDFDYEAESEFTLVSPINLNLNPTLRVPVNFHKKKNLCCMFFKKGAVTVEANIAITGFVAGQPVPIYLHVENLTNSNLDTVKFKLIQRNDFMSSSPRTKTKTAYEVITKKTDSGIGANGEKTYELALVIPQTYFVPNLNNCNIMKVSYVIEVVLPCPHRNITAAIPIVIGHVPLEGVNLSLTQTQGLPSYGRAVAEGHRQTRLQPQPQPGPSTSSMEPAPAYNPAFSGPPTFEASQASTSDNQKTTPPPTYEEATALLNP
ncbi:PREDICTED: arrestin domain-containing protein 4-like isoform X2 [Nicrophorus vespilloides]|uniref:Arrestin domain-containing protein 4-like isoform X2 n=1 Tax=Nicrophorus vespilloides TaxID=110193 RepID=A0ABM1MVX6_NICVS|nr:PREDICTED: arrestin domain-containing protein 4-like isoform X2 [Nicrophorus vespilloides]